MAKIWFPRRIDFRNKIVVVGPTAEIFHDVHTTPFGDMPGPEIQSQIIAALLHGKRLAETSPVFNIALTLGAMVLALALCLGIPQALLKALLLAFATVAFFAVCQFTFSHNGMVVLMTPPLFCLLASGPFGIIFEYALEQIERRRYRNIFNRYVSKNVANVILADRRSVEESMRGIKKPVTILFSDIRGFTTMTEKSDPEKLVAQLNEYFEKMVDIIQEKNSGTLQKFIGDAIMAAWGDVTPKVPATTRAVPSPPLLPCVRRWSNSIILGKTTRIARSWPPASASTMEKLFMEI